MVETLITRPLELRISKYEFDTYGEGGKREKLKGYTDDLIQKLHSYRCWQ